MTALIDASRYDYEDCVILLLQAGADQLITDYVSKNIIFISFQFCVFILLFFANNFHYFLYSIDRMDG